MSRRTPPAAEPLNEPPTTGYRSGAVARMVRMPVATLRIWERRYGVVKPHTTASGHRLYTAAQVQRLALLKQLTDLGHAIGAIAHLDVEGLQQVAATHATALAQAQGRGPVTPWRVAVVDASGAARWRALALRMPRPVQLVQVVDSLDALLALPRRRDRTPCDALLLALPQVQADDVVRVRQAARACGAQRVGLRHGFAAREVLDRLRAQGVTLLRDPTDEEAALGWLRALAEGTVPEAGTTAAPDPVHLLQQLPPVGPRRYDDATLADFAALSSTIACECPRHVAELLMQLSHFETYSAECSSRSPEDAALHRYLQQVAASARALFETALERVAEQDGLMLPNT